MDDYKFGGYEPDEDPTLIVHTKEYCPWCEGTEIASVYRDGGSTLYCRNPECKDSTYWKSKEWLENRKPTDWEKVKRSMVGESGWRPGHTHAGGLWEITK